MKKTSIITNVKKIIFQKMRKNQNGHRWQSHQPQTMVISIILQRINVYLSDPNEEQQKNNQQQHQQQGYLKQKKTTEFALLYKK